MGSDYRLFYNKNIYEVRIISKKYDVPIWKKSNLTLEEAAAYSGIGINKIRNLSKDENCKFVLMVGNKRMIKRKLFDTFIEQQYAIWEIKLI